MSSDKKPSIVPADEWVQRTAVAMSRRGRELERVDRAYAGWQGNQGNAALQAELLAALDDYLLSHGTDWDRVARNRASNGLMAYVHDIVRRQRGRANPFEAVDIPHSRYGVLYLLGNTQVELDSFKIGLEALEIGGGVVSAGASGALGSLPIAGGPVTARSVVNAALPLAGQAGAGLASKPAAPRPEERIFIHTQARSLVSRAIDAIVEKLQARMVADRLWAWKVSGTVLRQATIVVVEYIVGHLVPFLKTGMEVAHNAVKVLEHLYENAVVVHLRMKHFRINPGHPAQIARAIQMSLLGDLGSRLASVGVSVGKVLLEGVTGGAAVLVNALVTAVEWLTRWLLKVHEKNCMQTFLGEAATLLRSERQLGAIDATTGSFRPNLSAARGGIINDPQAFAEFFDRGCRASVVIPMLTLNSGICGSAMTYVRMFQSDASNAAVIDQATFDNSTAYFAQLKSIGARYLRVRGFKFSSRKADVNGYLMHAVRDHQQPESTLRKVLAMA